MSISPKLNSEQALLRLLTLIRDSKTIQDFTPARIADGMGIPMQAASEGRSGFGEQLTTDWWSAIELDPNNTYGPRFEFSFRPTASGTYPAMTGICQVDFEHFSKELQAMGFKHGTYRGEHNRIIHENFERDGLTIKVYTRGEADTPVESVSHACVSMVLIN